MQYYPKLMARTPLKSEFHHLSVIPLTSEEFTIGRGLNNMAVIPFLAISRNHCKFLKHESNWLIEDNSTFGIVVNGNKLGKGNKRIVNHEDIIELDQCQEFIYIFYNEKNDFSPPSTKRIKLEAYPPNDTLISNLKTHFEESQDYEKKHIEEKIENTKQMIRTKLILKEQLEKNMKRKLNILESEFTSQMENFKGQTYETLMQTLHLRNEKITELKEQIKTHSETETYLVMEKKILLKKQKQEREDFLSELNKETASKEEMLESLMAKIKKQEEIRHKEKQEFEKLLSKETTSLKLAKDEELNELTGEESEKELQLVDELNSLKNSLENQVESTDNQKSEALEQLNDQIERMKKLKDEDNIKMEQLIHERDEIQKLLYEAQQHSKVSVEKLQQRVREREVELAALAAERIQKQAEQSSEVINSLQDQLERVRNKLHSVEKENKKLLEHTSEAQGEGSSKGTIAVFGEIMESELQCSICAELFVSSTTLNCSHTFCKFCITMWKKRKQECPICRAPITSECKSLVLDSFIDKMLLNLSDEMKQKRRDLLKLRNEFDCELASREHEKRSDSDDYEEKNDCEEGEGVSEAQHFKDVFNDDTNSGSDWDDDVKYIGVSGILDSQKSYFEYNPPRSHL